MSLRNPLRLLSGLLLLLACSSLAHAIGLTTITLRAIRPALLANGKDSTDIVADVRDDAGRTVRDGTLVRFQTTAGALSEPSVPTFGGIARVRLTSAPVAGDAQVMAFAPGGVSQPLHLLFTDDPEATFAGNNYILATATGYLAYSATDRVIEADGKNAGARITYRNIDISADRMQFYCQDNIIRAHDHITLKRGNSVLHAERLFYSMETGKGYAVAQIGSRLQSVILTGVDLKTEPDPIPILNTYLTLPDLQVKLVIVARSITYFPNDRLQFRRPRFFQDQVQILSLPYYELAFNSNELFSDQFISMGTSGFGLDLPFYYDLTARSSGIVYLRHQEQLGASTFATEPGWSLDVVQGYSAQEGHRYEGALGLTGLTRGDWGFQWTHNQEFNSGTRGSFDVEFPHHDSVFSSTNLSQQFKTFRWGMNIGGGETFIAPVTSTVNSNLYVETMPHPTSVLRGLMYTVGTTITSGASSSSDPTIPKFSETTEAITLRAYTRPLALDKRTSLTNSFSVGPVWTSTGSNGIAALATLALDRTIPGGGALNLTYDLVTQPGDLFVSSGHHRMTATYNIVSGRRLQASIFGSAFLDARDASFLGDVAYRLDSRWRLLTSATLQRFGTASYSDIEFTIGRRIGARELQLTYSTFLKRLSVDFTATHF